MGYKQLLTERMETELADVEWETWDDPGDYPSNAGAGPLPSSEWPLTPEGRQKYLFSWEDLEKKGLYPVSLGDAFEELAAHRGYVESNGVLQKWWFDSLSCAREGHIVAVLHDFDLSMADGE